MTTPTSAPPTPRQAFGIAAGAVLAEINRHEHDTLGVEPTMVDTVLRRDWGIADRAELLTTLEWLAAEGHRKEFELLHDRWQAAGAMPADPLQLYRPQEFLSLSIEEQVGLRERARAATELLPLHRSLIAWDFGRLIMLARWGFSIGFLTEAEAWGWIDRGAAQIEAHFRYWLDVGENYLAGVRFWSKNDEALVDDTQAALDRLFDVKDNKSPWNRVPFPGGASSSDVERRLEARRTSRAKEHGRYARNVALVAAAIVVAIVAGRVFGPRFHPCERLDARLCADLGPEACEVWKGRFGKTVSGSSMRHEVRGRHYIIHLGMHLLLGWDTVRSHETCWAQDDDYRAYPATLQAIRATIAATR